MRLNEEPTRLSDTVLLITLCDANKKVYLETPLVGKRFEFQTLKHCLEFIELEYGK